MSRPSAETGGRWRRLKPGYGVRIPLLHSGQRFDRPDRDGRAVIAVATFAEALPLIGFRTRIVGMGHRRYRLQQCSALISAGFAGACHPSLDAGDILVVGADASSLAERIGAATGHLRTLATVAGPEQKRRLGEEGALAVDMETAWLARAAAARSVPFLGIRVIIDRLDDRAFSLVTARHFPRAAASLRRAVGRALELWP